MLRREHRRLEAAAPLGSCRRSTSPSINSRARVGAWLRAEEQELWVEGERGSRVGMQRRE